MRGRYSRGKTVMLVKEEELWKNCCLLYSADFARLKAQSDMNNDHVALSLLLRSIFWLLLVLQGVGFSFPVCLSFIHCTLSWALMAILKVFSVLPASPSSKSSRLSLFTLGFVMSLSTGLANVSLKYNSVRFYQMAKIAVTPLIVLAEFIWFKKRASFSKGDICYFSCCSWSIQNMRCASWKFLHIWLQSRSDQYMRGAFMAIAGMSCYTYLNIHNPKPQTGKLSPGKSSTQSRLSKGNGKGHDGYGGESV